MHIISIYAALLALFFVFLSLRVIRLRKTLSITIGDADNPLLKRAARVHSNFSEYVPISLIVLFLLESQAVSAWILHGLASLLCIGRLSHAYGVSQIEEKLVFRQFGMVMTFTVIISGALFLLFLSFK